MLKENYCPICKCALTADSNNAEPDKKMLDYLCKFKDDHFFAMRIKNNFISKIKVRVLDDDEKNKLFIKINFDENTTQVWKSFNMQNRIKIASSVNMDLTDVPKIRNKIKTLLLFS